MGAHYVKTGELMELVVVLLDDGQHELCAHEISSGERYTLPLEKDLLEELDREDPWSELFSVVGVSLGPPKKLVTPELISRDRVTIAPSNLNIIVTLYKYSSRRFFVNGFDESQTRFVDLVLMENVLTDEHKEQIDALDGDELFAFFCSRLQLVDTGELK